MNYKANVARIEFDPRDKIFWGKVLGIGDSVTFENHIYHLAADCRMQIKAFRGYLRKKG